MKMTKILNEIAKRSPKQYATIIRNRNEALLAALEELYAEYLAWCDEKLDVYNSFNRHYFIRDFEGYLGCPHCIDTLECSSCLWTECLQRLRFHARDESCIGIKFDGITLADLGHNKYIQFVYSITSEIITFKIDTHSNPRSKVKAEYEHCKRFLKAHIEWTKLPCWGELC